MKTSSLLNLNNINFAIFLLLTISFVSSCNTNSSHSSETKTINPVRDTLISSIELQKLEVEIQDYILMPYKASSFEKFKKYSVSFFGKCVFQSAPQMAGKYTEDELLNMIWVRTIKDAEKVVKQISNIEFEINKPVRFFLVGNLLFGSVEGKLKYKINKVKCENVSNMICILEDKNYNWKFLDKEECKEILECQYSKEIADSILVR